ELNISYIYDSDNPDTPEDDTGEFGLSPGYVYAGLLFSPEDKNGRTGIPASHNLWTIDDDPSSDVLKFQYMSNETYAEKPPVLYDYRFLQSVGPYNLNPGDSLRIIWTMGVGNRYKGMTFDMKMAKWLFENNFIITEKTLPPPPTNLVILKWNGNIVELIWDKEYTEYLIGHNVYRANSEDGPFTKINPEVVTENRYSDSTISPGQTYFYTVTNVDSFGKESKYSNIVHVKAGTSTPPTGLRASIKNSYISLAWNPHPDTSVTGFNIYRSGSSKTGFIKINTEIVTTTTFTDSTVKMDSTYYYAVTSLNKMGYESLLSGEVKITLTAGLKGRGILLVDDDDTTPDQEIDHAFHLMFRHFDYEDWDVSEKGIPSTDDLKNYSSVIWYTDASPYSFYYFSLPDTSKDYIPNPLPYYLDLGGHLWLISGEILYFSAAGDTGDIFDDSRFAGGYLHLDDGGDAGQDEFGVLVPMDPVIGGYTKVGIPGNAIGTGWPDEVTPDASAEGIYLLGPTTIYDPMPVTGVRYPAGGPASVVFWGVNASFYATNGNPLTLSPKDMEKVGSYILMDEFGESYMENPLPLPPKNFYISGWGEDYIDLTWSISEEEDVLGYNVYRSPARDGPYDKINPELFIDQYAYRDSMLTNTAEYWYIIRTVDKTLQEGPQSPEIMEIAGRPYTPAKPRIVSQSGNKIDFEWDNHPQKDVIGYNLYGRVYGKEERFRINDALIKDTTYSAVLSTNAYYISLTAVDSTNVESYYSVEIITLLGATFEKGILLIDDFSWDSGTGVYTSDADADAKIDQGFMHGFKHTDWDVPDQGTDIFLPDSIVKYSTVILYTNGGYASAEYADMLIAYGTAGGYILIAGYNNKSMVSDILTPFGFNPGFYGTFTGNYGGMDGEKGTAYENFNIDLPMKLDGTRMVERHYERVYPDAENTSTIFRVRGLDGDTRSCGIRSEMPGGNVIIIIGQTMTFWDQESQDTRDFGRYVLETEFGEKYTGIEPDNSAVPTTYDLSQNYPNPFNPVTKIKYQIPRAGKVTLKIYNILGQEIKTLVNKNLNPGYYAVTWDGTNSLGKEVSSGLYFYRLKADEFEKTLKMVILK
ncbi:MAG: FlgD immunoglobulin-like domain containing protein, partial [Fidelibacterota bacterium]